MNSGWQHINKGKKKKKYRKLKIAYTSHVNAGTNTVGV
jgi:hypothetical protein